ncbi:hypothetical protein Btru_066630 [Bulinus truncatus]|nr:hypothetical protein Btru_066630 [Bulinus truncatus]
MKRTTETTSRGEIKWLRWGFEPAPMSNDGSRHFQHCRLSNEKQSGDALLTQEEYSDNENEPALDLPSNSDYESDFESNDNDSIETDNEWAETLTSVTERMDSFTEIECMICPMIALFYFSTILTEEMCYFVGGTDDAATGILGNLIKPLSYHLPSEKICEKLRAMDSQICELRYDVKPDFTKLIKMKVGELKKILSNWGEDNACKGCAEKAEFIKKVRELMPKHEPEEWKKVQAAEKEL